MTDLPREFVDQIARAIGDPGSVVGRKFGPSWGEGNDGYAENEETVTRWSTRAVLEVLVASGYRREADVRAEVAKEIERMPHGLGRRRSSRWVLSLSLMGRLLGLSYTSRPASKARQRTVKSAARSSGDGEG